MNRQTRAPLLVLLAFLFSTPVHADVFTWNAKRQWSRLAEGRERTVLSGGATIASDATTIVADEIELWGTDFRYSMAKGSVTATDTERGIILSSDTLFYDRVDEIIRVDGFIDMQDLKNDVVVRGGFFEYYGKDEIALIQIGVRILKVDEDTELACRSEFARYLRADDILELSGMPRVTRNNDLYTAARITINLDTDEILLDRDVSGTLVTESEGDAGAGPVQTGPEAGASPTPGPGDTSEPASPPETETGTPEDVETPPSEPEVPPSSGPTADSAPAPDIAPTDTPESAPPLPPDEIKDTGDTP